MLSLTPDYHVHKHAVVSVKEIEQQLQQQRYSAYPIDVVCSPYHVSQHTQRQCTMQQAQPFQQNIQHEQVSYEQRIKQPQFQQNITAPQARNIQQMQMMHPNEHSTVAPNSPSEIIQGPRHIIDISMPLRTQLTYAQVANQQTNVQREAQRIQPQQSHQQAPPIQGHKQYQADSARPQQECFQQTTVPPQGLLQRQYQEQMLRRQQHEHYNQSLLMEQHKGDDRSLQQAQAFYQEQLQRQAQQQQMWSLQSGKQPVNPRVNQNERHINDQNMQIPHPTVRQLFLNARAQQQMQAINTANQLYQQSTIHSPRPQHEKTQQNVYLQQQVHQQPYNNVFHEQRIPWNNNNNSNLYSQKEPMYSKPAQLPVHSVSNVNKESQHSIPNLMSLDVGFRPEAAKVFQLPQQPNQTLAISHHVQQVSMYTEQQFRQNLLLQQQRGQHQHLQSSSTSFDQFVPPAETRRQMEPQQFFRDVAAVTYNTNTLNHANMR